MNPPPTKQWALLELALADYDKTVVDPEDKIDMQIWHGWDDPTKICYVCLGGCVMAQTLKIPRDEHGGPEKLIEDKAWREAMRSLDALRCGVYPKAPLELGVFLCEFHKINPIQWRADMDRFVQFLKEQDL